MNKNERTPLLMEESIREKVDAYMEEQFEGYHHTGVAKPKVIHDSVHGTNVFKLYEIVFRAEFNHFATKLYKIEDV